jgi:sugar lactone lactonase YvrE
MVMPHPEPRRGELWSPGGRHSPRRRGEIDPRDGSLVVCDAYRGLLRVTGDGRLTSLTHRAGGSRILLCDDAAVARDGVVYLTDSSNRFPVSPWRRGLLEHRPNRRVLACCTLHQRAGRYVMATGVRRHGHTLWLARLTEKAIARVALS